MLSSIPWNGPIATVRVGRVGEDYIMNPTRTEMEESDMEMVVSGNRDTVVMVEGEADWRDFAYLAAIPSSSHSLPT